MKSGFLILIACFSLSVCFGQTETGASNTTKGGKLKDRVDVTPVKDEPILADILVIDGDTFPIFTMEPVSVTSPKVFKNKREERRYWRLVRNVKKVYPYAKEAGVKLEKYEKELEGVNRKGKRRRIMKQVEDELVDEYGDELKELTITQGHILLKLIDRETGDTSYDIVKEMRGRLSAMFWQGLATLFDSDLKSEYDPTGEDKEIEEIVQRIEKGQL